jgi:hypothetical protein
VHHPEQSAERLVVADDGLADVVVTGQQILDHELSFFACHGATSLFACSTSNVGLGGRRLDGTAVYTPVGGAGDARPERPSGALGG